MMEVTGLLVLILLSHLVFDDIPWSTMYVLKHTLKKIKQTKLKLKMLPVRTDIDDIHDLTDFF